MDRGGAVGGAWEGQGRNVNFLYTYVINMQTN